MDALLPFYQFNNRLNFLGAGVDFADLVVSVSEGRYLSQVGDHDDLVGAGKVFQLRADGQTGGPSDAGVNFVEDEDVGLVRRTEN